MAYPAKTGRAAILAAATEQLARDGLRGMSLRALAGQLGLAPNALYRYFSDRSRLEAALSAEGASRLHATLRRAAGKKSPERALRAMARAYVQFAREQRSLYEVMMMACDGTEEDMRAHQELWVFVIEQVGLIAGEAKKREAAVALWAFLHGIAALEQADIFGEEKPLSSFDFGLNAWLRAASPRGIEDGPV